MKYAYLAILCIGSGLAVGCDTAPRDVAAEAKAYPRKAVTIVCPWAAGGGTDRVSRYWADALQQRFGEPFVVVNKTGGSGAVGHTSGALAKPDGYTLTMITAELSTMHHMGITKLTYEDFEPILQMNADAAAIIVRNESPWRSLDDMMKAIRDEPGKVKMSGTATGGTWDLARAGLLHAAELPVDSVIWVPTKGSAPSLIELLGGHLDAVCCSVPEAADAIDAGQLRVLAVMSEERLPEFPEIPTVRESGIDWVAVGWRGLAVPKGTPSEIVEKLNLEFQAIAQSPEFAEFMKKNGFEIKVRGPEEFRQFLQQDDAVWKPVIEAAGYTKA